MTTLIVTGYFLPGTNGGGPVNSIKNIIENVEGDFDIITNSTDVGSKIKYKTIKFNKWLNKENYRIKYLDNNKFWNILKIVKGNNYNIIYLNSLFSKFSIMFYIASLFTSTQIIIAPRGELNSNALNMKSLKKRVFILFFKLLCKIKGYKFHATSVNEQKDIKNKLKSNSVLISNLPSNIKISNRTYKKKVGNLNIMMVARINKMKNIHFAIQSISELEANNIVLDIYGPLEDIEYLKYCKNIKVKKNIHVNFKGSKSKNELNYLYNNYDLFYSPTLGENYGHAIIEAIQNHLPVLISNNTPWVNLEKKGIGYDYPLDEFEKIRETLQKLVNSGNDYYNEKFIGFKKFLKEELEINKNIKKYEVLLETKNNIRGTK